MTLGIPTLKIPAPAKVWVTGDWHLGSVHCDRKLFERHFARAVGEGWYLLHVGDALEMVTVTAKVAGKALREQIQGPEEQRQELINRLRLLQGGVILPGNHELRIDAATQLDFFKMVTDAVGEKFTPMMEPGFVRLLVGKAQYIWYLHHGEGPTVNPLSTPDRIIRNSEGADAILTGHIHQHVSSLIEVETPRGPRMIRRVRVGHYLKAPKYAKDKPVNPVGARGSWLATLHDPRRMVWEELLD